MSLKILIADDSMTAQNMGKKILADAGFEVVPVSNGAAAMKKIAETKPDIVVVDIFMPGYTGLEVCDKVKNAPETSNVPVLLTVGKLEPYRPEDGAKVRAEGVIIKPFEASDLLSAIGRIAEKYNLNVPQIEPVEVAAPAAPKAPEEFAVTEAAPVVAAAAAAVPAFVETKAPAANESGPAEVPAFIREASAAAAAPAPMFIIEDSEEAPAPAYNLNDLLGAHHEAPAMSIEDVEVPEPEAPVPFSASSVPDPTPTGSWHIGSAAGGPPPAKPVEELVEEVQQVVPELETTAAAKVEMQVENLMELETTPEVPVEVAPAVDPALVTDPSDMMNFAVKVGKVEPPAEVVAEAAEVGDDTSEFAAVAPTEAHPSYHDDPMVQMGAMSIEAPAPSQSGDDTMKISLQSTSGLEGALHEFESTEPKPVEIYEEVAAPEAATPEVAAHVEPEVVAEPEPVSNFVPESTYPTNVVAEMAAATPELVETAPEVIEVPEPPKHQEAEAALEQFAETHADDTKTLAAAVGMDASLVSRVVQKVFERYRDKMVEDIANELSKGE